MIRSQSISICRRNVLKAHLDTLKLLIFVNIHIIHNDEPDTEVGMRGNGQWL